MISVISSLEKPTTSQQLTILELLDCGSPGGCLRITKRTVALEMFVTTVTFRNYELRIHTHNGRAHTYVQEQQQFTVKTLTDGIIHFETLRNSCSSSGGAPTRQGTIFERVVLGRHQSFRIALRQVVLKLLMHCESNSQAWDPNKWQHCDIKILEDTFCLHV